MNEEEDRAETPVSPPSADERGITSQPGMQMPSPAEWVPPRKRLADIAEEVNQDGKPRLVTVRTLLGWFGYMRRGSFATFIIDQELANAGLITQPDYRSAWLDAEIALVPFADISQEPTEIAATEAEMPLAASFDPTYRLGRLRAANIRPVSVSPQQTVQEALTIMMANSYSQPPVMSGERTLNGVISLPSLAKRWALEAKCETVQDCLELAHVVQSDTFLFDAINDIINYQYVLVQAPDRTITGIVTTSDLSLEFRQLAEPFLLLGEIEQHLRVLIERGSFTPDELNAFRDEKDSIRTVSKASDLTFGEYVRMLEKPSQWNRLRLNLDRGFIVKQLQRIRDIRNDVMHFDPDPLDEDDLMLLRSFVALLQEVRQILYR